jgi:hypothetical protein
MELRELNLLLAVVAQGDDEVRFTYRGQEVEIQTLSIEQTFELPPRGELRVKPELESTVTFHLE